MHLVKFLMTFGGAVLCWFGIQEYRVSSGTSAEPLEVKLAEIEAGKVPHNNHIQLGRHIAVYAESFYAYSQSKYSNSDPTPETKVNYVYYPVISREHRFVADVAKFALQRGAGGKKAGPVPPPTLKDFAVLVKTKRFKTVGDIPDRLDVEDSRQGLIVNKIDSLDSDETKLIKQSFPAIDLDKVLILEDGRTPSSGLMSWGMMIGGALIALGGVGLYLGGLVSGGNPSTASRSGPPEEAPGEIDSETSRGPLS